MSRLKRDTKIYPFPFIRARPPFLLTIQSQLNEAATEAERYLYVAQSYIVYEQILHETVTKQIAMAFNSLCEAVSDGRSDGVRGVDQVFLPQELSDGIDKMWGSVGGLSFEPLERAVDR